MNKTLNFIEAKSYCDKLEKQYKKPVFLANMEIDYVYSLMSETKVKKHKSLLGFCAIGQPLQFFEQLEENDYELSGQKIFEDHHKYTVKDIEELLNLAEQCHCEQFITTEKDAVKLRELITKNKVNIDKEILVVRSKVDIDLSELFEQQ